MRTKSLTLGFGLLFWLSGVASATSYFGYETNGGTWSDANKTVSNTDDDLMCWAAATSNILAYTGWGFPQGTSFTGSNDIFAYYQDHWTDEGGNALYGVDWWFSGRNVTQGIPGWSQVDVAGGGFYTTLESTDYALWTFRSEYALGNTEFLLERGYGVGLSLGGPIAHAVTAWGIESDGPGNYQGLYITDSDDGYTGLRYYEIQFDEIYSRWFLQDYYHRNTVYISGVYGLQNMPSSDPAPEPVPEPTTVLLLGTGLAGLWAAGKRKNAR